MASRIRDHILHPEASALSADLRPYKATWLNQFRAVLWRSWHSVTKEPMVTRVRIAESFVGETENAFDGAIKP